MAFPPPPNDVDTSRNKPKRRGPPWGKTSLIFLAFIMLVISLHNQESLLPPAVKAPSPNHQAEEELVYYNWNRDDPQLRSEGRATTTMAHVDYPENGPVIATLVTNNDYDVNDMCLLLKSLLFIYGDKNRHLTPILVFNEGNLTPYQLNFLVSCATRPIAFPTVNFNQFPRGFDPINEHPQYVVQGRPKWGYYQATRFWINEIWKHPALKPYGTILKVDSDSCFKSPNRHLPLFEKDGIAYHAEYLGMETQRQYVEGLYDFTIQFLKTQKKEVNNHVFWGLAQEAWKTYGTLPHFRTNFEIIRKGFMQRGDVSDYHDFLMEHEPFGLYRFRWNDSVIRFMTMSLFATSDMVMIGSTTGFGHRGDCNKTEIETSLKPFELRLFSVINATDVDTNSDAGTNQTKAEETETDE